MGSDRARVSYDANQQYRAVVAQQGRVSTEADWNEAQQIASEEQREELIDIIGSSGTPDDGYKVVPSGIPFNFFVTRGTMYVGGIRAFSPIPIRYSDQLDWLDHKGDPDWLDIENLAQAPPDRELIYLLLREQEVSAVEDSALLEKALGGPDTTQRTRLIQRIVRLNTEENTCSRALTTARKQWLQQGLTFNSQTMRLMAAGRLQVSFLASTAPPDLCDPEARGGYLGAENQLIRVQISSVDSESNQYKLVWGFDNASFLYRVTATNSTTLKLQSQPVDDFHRPRSGQAVEVLRSAARLNNQEYVAAATGIVTTLTTPYNSDTQEISVPATLPAEYRDSGQTPRLFLRVWEEEISFTPGNPVSLGKTGLQVTLRVPSGRPFHLGDYWFFAVRPTTPTAIYPQRYFDTPQAPEGPRLWVCPLAVVSWTNRSLRVLEDCRRVFRSLPELQPAFHIIRINWRNDDFLSLESFIRDGLVIEMDASPKSETVTPATMIITLELPLFNLAGRNTDGEPTPTNSPDLAFILDGKIELPGQSIRWLPNESQIRALFATVDPKGNSSELIRLLLRVTLKGHKIWNDTEYRRRYLDGQVFGQPGVRLDGSPCTSLIFPSGNNQRASDFESWAYLGKPQPPDLIAQEIRFSIIQRIDQFNARVSVVGVVRNNSTSPFESAEPATVQLFEGLGLADRLDLPGTAVTSAAQIPRLDPGQEFLIRYERLWNSSSTAEGEFPPDYRLFINAEDNNQANNEFRRRGDSINDLFQSPPDR